MDASRTTPMVARHALAAVEKTLVLFASVCPIMLGTAAARRALPEQRLELARPLALAWWKRTRKVVLPPLIPRIAIEIRIAAPLCRFIVLLVRGIR